MGPVLSGGGRAHVRTALDLRTLVAVRDHPVLKVFYQRLRAAGKRAKVALSACRRKLLTMRNALVKHQTPWQPQEVDIVAEEKIVLDNQDSCSARASLRLLGAAHRRR